MEQENKNRVGLIVLLIAIILFAGGITFAFFRADVTGTQEKLTVQTGTLALTFSDNNTGITKNKLQLGESTTKEFKIENTGTEDVTTNMLWNNLINTYTEGSLTYKFEYSTNETGPWTAVTNASGNIPQSESASDYNLAENLTIPAHTIYYYQLTITFNDLPDVNQTVDKTAVLSSSFKLGDRIRKPVSIPEMVTAIINNETLPYVKSGSPTFSSVATEDETYEGLYSLPDDYGTSYYYRGAVTNNYVKFAGKYWRIIRVNGDGSLRMIYDGTQAHKNGGGSSTFTTTGVDGSTPSTDRFINNGDKTAFNTNYDDNAYVGWMYGTTGGTKDQAQINTSNSPIKDLVNTWYDNNLASYDQYIADAVYCADRSIPGQSVTGWSSDTGLGTGTNVTAYGTFGRLANGNSWTPKDPSTPQFKCQQKNDAFTVSDSIHGNAIGASKSRKVGLITSDEITAAGGAFSVVNRNYYLYKSSNSWYWSITPSMMNISGYATVFNVGGNGALNNTYVSNTLGAVAPVISIKAEYAAQLTGTGIVSNPYVIPGV